MPALAAATRRLNAAMARLTSEPIVYEHAAGAITIPGATHGRGQIETGDEFGIAHLAETDDWLLDAAALTVAGEPYRPRPGDRIRQTDAQGRETTYEVQHPGNEEPWRWCDSHRQRLRIHTKRVA